MKLIFNSLLYDVPKNVWEKTTDFDFVRDLNRPFLTLKYDKRKLSPVITDGYAITTSQYLFGFLPLGAYWCLKIVEWQPYKYFVDIVTKSPLKNFRHTHNYEEVGKGTCYTDHLDFEPVLLGPVAVYFIKLLFDNWHKNLRKYFNSSSH